MVPYCTPAEIKSQLGITDTDDDELIGLACEAASEQIDHHCGQTFNADTAATARTFRPESNLWCEVDPISTTTGLVVKVDDDDDGTAETTIATSDYVLRPRNASAHGVPYTEVFLVPSAASLFPHLSVRDAVEVTALWGWPSVPVSVQQAARVQATQLYKAKDTAFGVAGFGDFGVLRVQARMNPVAAALLAGFRLPAVG